MKPNVLVLVVLAPVLIAVAIWGAPIPAIAAATIAQAALGPHRPTGPHHGADAS